MISRNEEPRTPPPKKTDRRPEDFVFGTEGCGGEGGKSSRALEPRKELRQHIPTGLEGRRYRKLMAEHRLPIAEKPCGRARKAVETERE
ncbi:MAG: hypothetical protein M3495_18320 [Pseudomonadota bacterium]|nr:hypothetical protein [Gammaproteobacteria bacterium]MDQ3583438.1 hypothetical protein [Pseudomonadota bacterium]